MALDPDPGEAPWLSSSDEDILLAIRQSPSSGGASLAEILARGDALNHALFTLEELQIGLARLLAARFIAEREGRFRIQEAGRDPRTRGGRRSDAPDAAAPRHPGISEEVYRSAVREYQRSWPSGPAGS